MSFGNDMNVRVNCDDCRGPSEEDRAGDYRLLHEIEAMSKALCHPLPFPCRFSTSSEIMTPSSRKSAILSAGSVFAQAVAGDSEGENARKSRMSKSAWSWRKPLKALSRIRDRKFPCFFFLHVHSIEGLPGCFGESSFCVEFVRKGEALRTRPSRVFGGVADFKDTLMHRCTVYCHKIDGTCNSCKYEPKLFEIRAYVNEPPGIDLGKHRVDLTGLLPVTLEEPLGGKSSGKWTTSFQLAEEARGAVLNVSFGYSLGDQSTLEYRDEMTVSELMSMSYSRYSARRSTSGSRNDGGEFFERLRCSGSIPGSLESKPGVALVDPTLEVSDSTHFARPKINENESSTRLHCLVENVEPGPVKEKDNSGEDTVEMTGKVACDDVEYVVIDRGIEIPKKDQSGSFLGDAQPRDGLNEDNVTRGLGLGCEEEIRTNVDEGAELNSINSDIHARKSKECEESHREAMTKYGTSRINKEPTSLERARADTKTGADQSPSLDLDRDPESPRERLLREFKEETLASGSFIIGFDSAGEEENASDGGGPALHDSQADLKVSVITLAQQFSGDQHDEQSWSLKVRRKLNMLADLEHESFSNSRFCDASGFGSPVELSRA